MVIYKFIIDKDISFLYWLQSLVDWESPFDGNERVFYRRSIEPLSDEEREALGELKDLFREPRNSAIWLWRHFAGKVADEQTVKKKLDRAQRVFGDKFEQVWSFSYPRLKKWQKMFIEKRPPLGMFEALNDYFKTGFGGEVQVILNINHNADKAKTYSDPEYGHLISLNVSQVKYKHEQEVYELLVRETVKLVEYLVPEKVKAGEVQVEKIVGKYLGKGG